jgi:hypothetical protein
VNTRWSERQLPRQGEVFVDHVGYFVTDLAAAGAAIERLGFRVSLVNVQTNADARGGLKPSGTSNRLAKLKFGFLEILAATHDTPLVEQFRKQIARYSGLHLIAFSAADMAAERRRLTAAGFAMQQVVELKRRDRTLPGAPEIHFSVLRPQPGVMAEGRLQWVRPHTPDTVWREETISQNGAEGLTDVLLCVDDPSAAAERYGRYVGRALIARGARHVIPLDRGGLVFANGSEAAKILPDFRPPALPFMAGQALRADLATIREMLARGGVTPVFSASDLICVGPADALGAYLLFHAPTISDPWGALGER